MKLATRLLLALLPTVTAIMVIYAGWALIEREQTVLPTARQEVEAYATALGLALDLAVRDVRRENVQPLLNEVSRAPTVYGILIYDSAGARTIVSDPLETPTSAPAAVLARVLRTGASESFEREIDDQRVYSVLRALRGSGNRITGALEVAQPMAASDDEKTLVRRRFLLNTLTLLGATTLVTLWLVHRVVARPIGQLALATRAIGQGDLSRRIPDQRRAGELADLAREFNGMAESLEQSRATVAREIEERLALERRLQGAEKMAAIGTLSAGLAHEIAAPLSVIAGRAEMMLRKEPDPTTRRATLGVIVQQTDRITRIVRNLLDFARRREPRLVPIDLTAVVDAGLELLADELARAEVEVEREEPGQVPVQGDPDLLLHVVVNLVSNAIQAMETGEGPRVLRLESTVASEDGIRGGRLVVADSGPGIPDHLRDAVFDPFVTTKPRGTGLGLAIVRRIVDDHRGRIDLATVATGAAFRVWLPASAGGEPSSRG